ncbi:hypothetical protein PM10SUCC1_06680 [Propionigenium maris DSM 9537]|uniref:Maltose O-acetyltransferase n=1 Tax=Propionigenium maris DSM 9537 TaxID=1123000 RepID=A0A9W6GJ58_9FUSO|nr:DapH/DapD/GlmU-related protein [Propionigenium maris]GLI55153.1 hypothetical protein PM10SUCC1_06680 [Propionigenium maris DSM 9537]
MFGLLRKIRLKITGYQDIEKLKTMGLKIGEGVSIQHGCLIDENHCWHISIGDRVTLAPNVHILAHDASIKRATGYAKVGKVEIGSDVFIGAGSIILPGVEIGEGTIVGAGSVVTKDIPPKVVAGGNPARVICTIDEYLKKIEKQMEKAPVFDESYSVRRGVSAQMKDEMNEKMTEKIGFLE